jgi:uncharacterized repeat protein (TIGR01451 family)
MHRSEAGPLGHLTSRAVLAVIILCSLALSGGAVAQAPGRPTPLAGERIIVQLDAPPLLAAGAALADALVGPAAASALARQAAVSQAIGATVEGAQVEAAYSLAYSGLAVRVPRYDSDVVARLLAIPGVKGVYPEAAFAPAAYESLAIIGAPELWQQLGGRATTGQGVRIAILDSGIAIGHPMFHPEGWSYPAGYPKGWPLHTTAKVIAARAYFRPTDPPVASEDAPTPGAAGSAHGTHAAAIAAGNPVTATLHGVERTLSGVAPGAYLMNYRVFYPSAADGVERAYTTEILQAIEDAVADGAQVLYGGWSGDAAAAYAGAPIEEALRAAADLGIVVVAPAGNDGPGAATAGRLPGGLETPITVGAQGAPYGRALFGAPIDQVVGPWPLVAVSDLAGDSSPYACAPLPAGSLAGKAALVARGGCPFADKAYHAEVAGAELVLIYNISNTVTDMGCSGQYCDPDEITVPAAMLASEFGAQLLAWLGEPGATPEPEIALSPTGRVLSASPELVAPASSRGPAYLRLLKPDLIAPGVGVVAAGLGADAYLAMSGSSVAAAHVAGAAAALLHAHPAWGHAEVKAALMGTARLAEPGAPDELPPWTGVLDRGAGLVDLGRAAGPALLLDPPSLSQPGLTAGVARETVVQVHDLRDAGDPLVWQVAIAPSEGLALTGPETITTTAGATVALTLTWQAAQAHVGDVEAMVRLEQAGESYTLPAWGYVHALPQAGRVLLLDNDTEFAGGSADTRPAIEAALTALGVPYDVWNADALFGAAQTLPDLEALQRYVAILWSVGEKRNPDGTFVYSTPPTARDQQLLMSYLDGGGRLLAMGQNLASATDNEPDPDPLWGRSALYHGYLGAHRLRDDVFGGGGAPSEAVAVAGLAGSFLQGVALDLGPLGSGAANQHSIDELGLGGSPQGYDAELVQPVAAALGAAPAAQGLVMLAIADEPTLENATPRIPYRALHQSFGLEGVNERPGVTTAAELLRRQLNWLLDEVQVTVAQGLVGGPYALTRLEAVASSSVGASITGYRWLIEGAGGPRLIESQQPVIHLLLEELGEYAVTVEATDALGHKALGQGSVRIVSGGASDLAVDRALAAAGDTLTYTVTVRNTEAITLTAAYTLPLPAHTTYQSHTGASWDGTALAWADVLAPGETHIATLTVQVDDAPGSAAIEAVAEFTVGEATFSRRALTRLMRYTYLPGVMR